MVGGDSELENTGNWMCSCARGVTTAVYVLPPNLPKDHPTPDICAKRIAKKRLEVLAVNVFVHRTGRCVPAPSIRARRALVLWAFARADRRVPTAAADSQPQ